MEAGLDSLKFSMNYYSADQLHEVAKVSPRFWKKSIDNLKSAKLIRTPTGTSVVSTPPQSLSMESRARR